MNRSFYNIPSYIRFLFGYYFIALGLLFFIRLGLFFYIHDDSYELFNRISFYSFIVGLKFDTVVLCYLLSFPFLLLTIQAFFNIKTLFINYLVSIYLALGATLLLILVIVDIPIFKFFQTRLSEASLQWLNSWKMIVEMIVENKLYLSFFIFILLVAPFTFYKVYTACRRNFTSISLQTHPQNRLLLFIYFITIGGLCFLGLRGNLSHPIRMGDAFYCHCNLLNQLGLNPAFSLMKSYTEKVNLMDNEKAISQTRQLLHIDNPDTLISPIARTIIPQDTVHKYNIVLVLMESMSAHYMAYFGNKEQITPNLDALTQEAVFFTNAYSAGIHTNNGIFSTLYSFPALKRIRPMHTMPIRKYTGLPYVTKQYGYQNLFFSAHSFEFDNIVNFIPANHFDRLYSSELFPPEAALSAFGVPDQYLYDYTLQTLDTISKATPFFATILTASNHEPYVLPNDFKTPLQEKNKKTAAYADWSIGDFLKKAQQSSWFHNTLFVFVADHGFRVGYNAYDLPLSYQHIPIFFYAPHILKPTINNHFIGQIDIFPTLMGLMNMRYINNTLGTDILKNPRSCIYFSADDKIGCIDNQWLYVYRFNGSESLYEYTLGRKENVANEHPDILEKLRNYAFSQIQTAEWMYSHDKTMIQK